MNTKELIDLKNDVFEKINEDKYMSGKLRIIERELPAPEWIIELPSKSKQGETYKTIPLDIMEGALRRIFSACYLKDISIPVFTIDKFGRYAATVNVNYYCNDCLVLPGIATVVVDDIRLLELSVPRASSMAVKNAIKQLGGLFGKYLNREDLVEEEMPDVPQEKKPSPEEEELEISKGIRDSKTTNELKQWRFMAYRKGQNPQLQEQYEAKLTELLKK